MAKEHSTCITSNTNPSEIFQSKVHTPPEMQILRESSTCQYALRETSCVCPSLGRGSSARLVCHQQTTETLPHRGTMFCRAKGKLPRLSVNPATFATANKVPDESSKSLAKCRMRCLEELGDTYGYSRYQDSPKAFR